MAVKRDKPVSAVLDETFDLLYYEGWVWRAEAGTARHPGYCLVTAVAVANHGSVRPTEDMPNLEDSQRKRGSNALRVLLDAVDPEVDHMTWTGRRARRALEEWNDVFARQQCDVLAAVRRALKLARYREDVGLLL